MKDFVIEYPGETILWDSKMNAVLTDQERLIGNLALIISVYEKCWFKASDKRVSDYLGNCLSLKEVQSNEIMIKVFSSSEFSGIKNNLFVMLYPTSQKADEIIKGLTDEELVGFCRAQENSLLKCYEYMVEHGDRTKRALFDKHLKASKTLIHEGDYFLYQGLKSA